MSAKKLDFTVGSGRRSKHHVGPHGLKEKQIRLSITRKPLDIRYAYDINFSHYFNIENREIKDRGCGN